MSGISDEQRAEWRKDAQMAAVMRMHGASPGRILALLAEVDTLRNQLRDMEIERNMLRITTVELTERLGKVEALHYTFACQCDGMNPDHRACAEDGQHWPCDTIAALSTERGA